MNPATVKTEPPPSARLRKTVFGSFHWFLAFVFAWGVMVSPAMGANPAPEERQTPERLVAPVNIHLPHRAGVLTKGVAEILTKRLREYCEVNVVNWRKADLQIYLKIKPGLGLEGFRISDGPRGGISIIGNDERGLLYGAGQFLHTCTHDKHGFIPSQWRGLSVPKQPVRGMYLATHFGNFYEEAPIEEVKRYVEDLSLWGINSYLVWFNLDAYNGIEDAKAQAKLARLRALLQTVKDLGLNASLGCVANEGYANSPVNLRADSSVGHDGYHTSQTGRVLFTQVPNLGYELCPGKPGVPEMEVSYCEEKFAAFKSIGLDYWVIWPYDNGGCTSPDCAPWGANGYLRMAELEARAYQRAFPQGKVILSTWYFDRFIDGEWAGITDKFNQHKPDWVDYILTDDYGGNIPQYPLTHGSPGGLALLNFPEISMYLHFPWGGYGANPLPQYLQKQWNASKTKMSGGFPYSEGIYEDVNKVMVAQLYWNPDKPAEEGLRDYIAFYFSADVAGEVSRAMDILERNLERVREDKGGVTRFILKNTVGAEEAYRLIKQADAKLPDRVRSSWRWRIVYLRALIDSELAKREFRASDNCVAAFQELTTIYHEEQGSEAVAPPRNVSGVVSSSH
jgi:hypothetical protein